MRQKQIVLPLGHMVGKFIAERKTQPRRRAILANDINADDLRFLAAIECKIRRQQRRARQRDSRAIALVEPFRLHPARGAPGLALLQAHLEHFHGVGEFCGITQILVHLVAALCRAKMRQAGAGDMQMRRIGVIDRRQHTAFLQRGGKINRLADAARRHALLDGLAIGQRFHRQRVAGAHAFDHPRLAARCRYQRALARLIDDLCQPHFCPRIYHLPVLCGHSPLCGQGCAITISRANPAACIFLFVWLVQAQKAAGCAKGRCAATRLPFLA